MSTLAGCRCGDPKPDYSDGYRVGRIEKFSHKGFFWKSWEGYLVLQGYDHDDKGNLVRKEWQFSILPKDADKVVPLLQKAQEDGGLVKLHYHQDWMDNIHYNSEYFVDGVTEVK